MLFTHVARPWLTFSQEAPASRDRKTPEQRHPSPAKRTPGPLTRVLMSTPRNAVGDHVSPLSIERNTPSWVPAKIAPDSAIARARTLVLVSPVPSAVQVSPALEERK